MLEKFIFSHNTTLMGTVMKYIVNRLDQSVAQFYQLHGLDFEPKIYSLFQYIKHKKSVTSADAARELCVSHVTIVKLIKLMKKKQLIVDVKDSQDGRCRLISLSDKGKKTYKEMLPFWNAIDLAMQELIVESAPELMKYFINIDDSLDNCSFIRRINSHYKI